MPYDCQLIYRPGRDAENPADFMSRHPSSTAPKEPNLADVNVSYVSINAGDHVPKAMTSKKSNKKPNMT